MSSVAALVVPSSLSTAQDSSPMTSCAISSKALLPLVSCSLLCPLHGDLLLLGAWVCFNGLNQLSASLLSILSQHLSSLLQAQQAGKSSVMIDTCEVPLNMDAGCFACLDSSVRVKPSNPENVLIFHSVASTLPQDLLVQFRAVSLVKPDNRFTMEVLLLSQGEKTCPLMYLNSIVARFPQCC